MSQWVSAWGYKMMDYSSFPIQTRNRTVAVQFKNNVRGSGIRLLVSNIYDDSPLSVSRIWVTVNRKPDAWHTSCPHFAALQNSLEFTVPPHVSVYTDVIPVNVDAGDYITVFVRLDNQEEVLTGCSCFHQNYTRVFSWENAENMDTYLPENSTRVQTKLLELEDEHECFYGVEQVEVLTEDDVKTLVCFGDSITHRSFWTGPLAERLISEYPGKITLINCGISGNRILYDESPFSPFGKWFGKAGKGRFENDVFNRNRVDLVFILQGINDIFHPLYGHAPKNETVTANELIEGQRSMIACAKRHGAKVIGCTVTPWKNCLDMFASEPEAVRTDLNSWIMTGGEYDVAFDFSAMIADPADPETMLPLYDSGDHVHPSAEGGARIAEAIELKTVAELLNIKK